MRPPYVKDKKFQKKNKAIPSRCTAAPWEKHKCGTEHSGWIRITIEIEAVHLNVTFVYSFFDFVLLLPSGKKYANYDWRIAR